MESFYRLASSEPPCKGAQHNANHKELRPSQRDWQDETDIRWPPESPGHGPQPHADTRKLPGSAERLYELQCCTRRSEAPGYASRTDCDCGGECKFLRLLPLGAQRLRVVG